MFKMFLTCLSTEYRMLRLDHIAKRRATNSSPKKNIYNRTWPSILSGRAPWNHTWGLKWGPGYVLALCTGCVPNSRMWNKYTGTLFLFLVRRKENSMGARMVGYFLYKFIHLQAKHIVQQGRRSNIPKKFRQTKQSMFSLEWSDGTMQYQKAKRSW